MSSWVEAESKQEAIEYALGPKCPLPDGDYIPDSLRLDEDAEIETSWVRVTKVELLDRLINGETLEGVLPLRRGQGCQIFKAGMFRTGDSIIYIPDVDLNDLVYDERIYTNDEELVRILRCCYTGDDFVKECDGDEELAELLFNYCDWQHPSSALPELSEDEESE